jgi:phosphatidylserine/phosphatidylglycerophosphate/cardiolipin synthase-like enzyme
MNSDIIYLSTPKKRIRAIHHLIQVAKHNIVLQMYLFSANGELKTLQPVEHTFPWARTLAGWLIEKKRKEPTIKIIVILDTQTIEDASATYVKREPLTRHLLESEGILVFNASLVETRYDKNKKFLPYVQFHKTWEKEGIKYTKQEWASLQNKWQSLQNVEDHRKNLSIDSGKAGLIFSHNIIDIAYRWHENTFLLRRGLSKQLWKLALASLENALALPIQFNSTELDIKTWLEKEKRIDNLEQFTNVSVVVPTLVLDTGPKILERILRELQTGEENGIKEIFVASAYFSDLQSLKVLSEVGKRIPVRILIDNCHALPLHPLLSFLLRNTVNLLCIHFCRKTTSLELRQYLSKPTDMMHLKAIAFWGDRSKLISGQANFTPNSFSGAWLETDIYTEEKKIVNQFASQFEELWNRSEKVLTYSSLSTIQRFLTRLHAWFFLLLLRIFGLLGLRY